MLWVLATWDNVAKLCLHHLLLRSAMPTKDLITQKGLNRSQSAISRAIHDGCLEYADPVRRLIPPNAGRTTKAIIKCADSAATHQVIPEILGAVGALR